MAFNDTNVDRDVMIKDGKVIAYEVLTALGERVERRYLE